MPVRIRLSRVGKKHAPFYRVITVDSRKKRDGAFLDDLGTYDALKSTIVRFDEKGYERRISQGAIPSDSVKRIYNQFKAEQAEAPAQKPKTAASKKTAQASKKEEGSTSEEQAEKS